VITIQTRLPNPLPLDAWEVLAIRAKYSPRRLAALCQVSQRTVQRHFRTHYNVTVCEWLNNLRLQRAYKRLLAGDRIKEVALELGFKQLSHFSRVFKARFGYPPRTLQPSAWTTSRTQLILEDPSEPTESLDRYQQVKLN
jgi:AraC-like DNA-binding protein